MIAKLRILFKAKELFIVLRNLNEIETIEDLINENYAATFKVSLHMLGVKLQIEDSRHYRLWLVAFLVELYELDTVIGLDL